MKGQSERIGKAENPTELIEAQKRAEFKPEDDKTLKTKAKSTKCMPFRPGMIKEGYVRSKACHRLRCRRCGRAHV